MLAAHYSTALIADQRLSKSHLFYLLVISQLQDFLWLGFAVVGLEPTEPHDVMDTTLSNMTVDMLFSHDLLPQLIWCGLTFLVTKILFNNNKLALASAVLVIGHFILDFFSGHPHHIFGPHSAEFGLGLYASHVYTAIAIEAVFTAVALVYFFKRETLMNVHRSFNNKAAIIAVFLYGIIFLLLVATTSVRQWLGIPEFDLGFNTTLPTLVFTYVGMALCLNYLIPRR